MRLIVPALASLALACVSPTQPTAVAPQPAQQSGATCDQACAHYLACKGGADASLQEICLGECVRLQVEPAVLAQYLEAECASAIAIVEGNGEQGAGGAGGGAGAAGSDCQGCVRDGESCVWISQSNWGQGPYSGAVATCNAACCGM